MDPEVLHAHDHEQASLGTYTARQIQRAAYPNAAELR